MNYAQERQFLLSSSCRYPLKPKSCAGHNSHTVWDNLLIFGKDKEGDP